MSNFVGTDEMRIDIGPGVFLAAGGIALLAVMPGTAALAGPPPAYFVDESKLPFDPLPGATALWGIHTRAGYRIEVPDDWNGDLVLLVHGSLTGLFRLAETYLLFDIVSIMWTGMRMVRAWSAIERVIAWRIHQVA